jgi:hypothetical protein
MRLPKLRKLNLPQFASAKWSLFYLWQLENEEMEAFCQNHWDMANAGKTVLAQFTKVRSIHRGFTSGKSKNFSSKCRASD